MVFSIGSEFVENGETKEEKQSWNGEIKTVKESDIRRKGALGEYRYIGMFKVSKKS